MTNQQPNQSMEPRDPEEQVGMLRTLLDRGALTWKLMMDERVNLAVKLVFVILTVAYVVSPVDIMPELVFGPIGVLDDVGLAVLALNLFIEAAPQDIVKEHLREMRSSYANDEDVVEGEATRLD